MCFSSVVYFVPYMFVFMLTCVAANFNLLFATTVDLLRSHINFVGRRRGDDRRTPARRRRPRPPDAPESRSSRSPFETEKDKKRKKAAARAHHQPGQQPSSRSPFIYRRINHDPADQHLTSPHPAPTNEDAEAAPAQHGVVPRAPKQQPGQQRCDHPDGAGRGRGLIDAPLSPPQRVMG